MLGIVVSLSWELKTLTRQSIPLGSYLAISDNTLVALSGIGAQRARTAATLLISRGATALLSWGCAAALEDEIRAGSVLLPEGVIDTRGETLSVTTEWHHRLYQEIGSRYPVRTEALVESAGLLKTPGEKQLLARRTQAIATDMESAAQAKVAREHRLPFIAVRAVLDSLSTPLPEKLMRSLDARGEISPRSFLQHIVLRPADWSTLMTLWMQFSVARRTLTRTSPVVLNCSRSYLNSVVM